MAGRGQVDWEVVLGSTPYNYAGGWASIMEALSPSACVHNVGSTGPQMDLWTEIRKSVNLNGKKDTFMFATSYMRFSHLLNYE